MSSDMTDFYDEEIEFSINEITLSGTLVIPQKEQNSCVILLSGYGPVTRDNTTRDFKRYKYLAEQFAKRGIASLRFDDRGSGKSTDVNWHNYKFEDLADEALAAYSFVKNNPKINSKKVGFVGHSLGAFIGPLAASKNAEIAFVVSAASHGLVGIETAIHTRNAIAKSVGESEEETIKWSNIIRNIIQEFRDKDLDPTVELKQLMVEKYQKLSEQVKSDFPTFESYIVSTLEGFLLAFGNTPMYRSFLAFDPQEAYKQLKCPILLMFAGSDLIHPSDVHKNAIMSALNTNTRNNVTIHDFPDANHDFTKKNKKGEWEFLSNFCGTIVGWITNIM